MKHIPLTGKRGRGKFAIVDDGDYSRLAKLGLLRWGVNPKGYVTNGRLYLHREVMQASKVQEVDHRDNSDRLNCQKENLRFTENRSQNHFNRGKQKNNTTGFKGVLMFLAACSVPKSVRSGGSGT